MDQDRLKTGFGMANLQREHHFPATAAPPFLTYAYRRAVCAAAKERIRCLSLRSGPPAK